jgi:hypothetical protein
MKKRLLQRENVKKGEIRHDTKSDHDPKRRNVQADQALKCDRIV